MYDIFVHMFIHIIKVCKNTAEIQAITKKTNRFIKKRESNTEIPTPVKAFSFNLAGRARRTGGWSVISKVSRAVFGKKAVPRDRPSIKNSDIKDDHALDTTLRRAPKGFVLTKAFSVAHFCPSDSP